MTAGNLLTAYLAILSAELVGDKTIYTVGSLAARQRATWVLLGAGLAASLKMLVAVMVGHLFSEIPMRVLSLVSCVTFLGLALFSWRKQPPSTASHQATKETGRLRVVVVAFLAIFLTEWADPGQIAAALMAARFGGHFWIWLCGSLAMVTKIFAALWLGRVLQSRFTNNTLRIVTTIVCLVMAILAAFQIEL